MPTPFDRNLGIKLGAKALSRMVEILDNVKESFDCVDLNQNIISNDRKGVCMSPDTAEVIGMFKNQIVFTSVEELAENADFEYLDLGNFEGFEF